ncbi:MAG TPA: hypothetical protein PLP83_01605 [Candidatus Aminicenantes bacterium]|nr:hypothetical protein [Candidatus Aminicenantes bacterium]
MRHKPVILAVIFVLSASADILIAQKPGRQLVAKAADFVEIVNDAKPVGPVLEIKFVQDLSLRESDWTPFALRVNDRGEIHVFTGKTNTLVRFDASGKETLRKDFRPGQGPGEFGFFDPEFASDGRLLVLDGRQRRLTVFDGDFKLLNVSKVALWGDDFRLDRAGNIYLIVTEFLANTRDRQLLTLTKGSPQGKPLLKIHEYEWGLTRDSRGVYHGDAYRRQVKFQIDDRGNLWYASTDRYEIHVVSPEGQLIRTIAKRGDPRKVTEEEIGVFKANDAKFKTFTDIPERMPPIADIFLLDPDYVLVVTFESLPGEGTLVGDVFDREGRFRGRTRLPKYDGWDFLMAPSKPRALARNGSFYTIETPEDGNDIFVRRYKIVAGKGS